MTLQEVKDGVEKAGFRIKQYRLQIGGRLETYNTDQLVNAKENRLSRRVKRWQVESYDGNDRVIILHVIC